MSARAARRRAAQSALFAFGEAIATIARSALMRDVAIGRSIVARREIRLPDRLDVPTHRAETILTDGGWRLCAWKYEDKPDGGYSVVRTAEVDVEGHTADTAAEVVEMMLRIASEWQK